MISIFNFEFKRIFFLKKLSFFMAIFFMTTIYLTNSGLGEYKAFVKNKKVFSNLEKKKISRENIKKIKRKNLSDEIMKKIYAAAIMVDEAEIIVVNDFLKGESKAFERQFLTLLQLMEAPALRQTYLSDEVKDTDRIIDLTEVSLR